VLFALFGGAIKGLLVGVVLFVVTATLLAVAYLALKVWQGHARQNAEAGEETIQAAAKAESQALAAAARAARQDELARRFGAEAAQRIVAGQYWAGATSEMLLEALGTPTHIRERVLKTKTKQTYCYFPTGIDRFRLRIHLEDGCVVGWDGQ
jgi:hypothetical protein